MQTKNTSILAFVTLLTMMSGCAPQYVEPNSGETATLTIVPNLSLSERPSVRMWQGECSNIGNCSNRTIYLVTKLQPGEEAKFFGKSIFDKTVIKIPAHQKFKLNSLWYPYGERGGKVCNMLSAQILAVPNANYYFTFEDGFENDTRICSHTLTELPIKAP